MSKAESSIFSMSKSHINKFLSLTRGVSSNMWPGDQIEDFVDAMGLLVNYKDIITLVTANIVRFAKNDLLFITCYKFPLLSDL